MRLLRNKIVIWLEERWRCWINSIREMIPPSGHASAMCQNPEGWRESAFGWMNDGLTEHWEQKSKNFWEVQQTGGALPRPGPTRFSHILKDPFRYNQVYAKFAKERKINSVSQLCPSSLNFKIILVFTDVNTYKF